MVFGDLLSSFRPRNRVLFGFLIGFLVPASVLAASYVFGNGPSLTGMEEFVIVDSMLFATASFASALMGGGIYYYFTDDVSTSLAPVIGVFAGLHTGFEDFMVYVFCTVRSTGDCGGVTGLPGTWEWLNDSVFIGNVQSLLGFSNVTDLSLVLAVVLGLFLSLFLVKTSDQIEFEVLGIDF